MQCTVNHKVFIIIDMRYAVNMLIVQTEPRLGLGSGAGKIYCMSLNVPTETKQSNHAQTRLPITTLQFSLRK